MFTRVHSCSDLCGVLDMIHFASQTTESQSHDFLCTSAGKVMTLYRTDQITGGALLEFHVRTAMHGEFRVSSELDDSGNCIIRKTWLHLFDLERNLS